MAKRNSPGCTCCPSCAITISGTVCACPSTISECCPISGVTVNLILAGVTVQTTTTNSLGDYSFAIASAGAYTVTAVSPGARWANGSATVNATCNNAYTANIGLQPAAGYICAGAQQYPIATTLHITTPQGSTTITYQVIGGIAGWYGSLHFTTTYQCPSTPPVNPTTVNFYLSVSGSSATINVTWCYNYIGIPATYCVSDATDCPTGYPSDSASCTSSWTQCAAFALACTMPGTGVGGQLNPDSGSYVITE